MRVVMVVVVRLLGMGVVVRMKTVVMVVVVMVVVMVVVVRMLGMGMVVRMKTVVMVVVVMVVVVRMLVLVVMVISEEISEQS